MPEYPSGLEVGELREPTDAERKRFMDVMSVYRLPMSMAFDAAQTLARVSARATVYTQHGADVPELLRKEIDAALNRWEHYRWTPRSNWRYP